MTDLTKPQIKNLKTAFETMQLAYNVLGVVAQNDNSLNVVRLQIDNIVELLNREKINTKEIIKRMEYLDRFCKRQLKGLIR